MNASFPTKTYDSIEYGILLPDNAVTPERRLKKRRMSWSKCLCITVLVILATLFLATAAISLCGYFWAKHQVERFTTDAPVNFPIHELPDAELDIVKDRAKLFYDTLKAGETPETDLVISEDEINAFIAHSEYLRGNAYVQLGENKFHADMSLPAKGLPGGKGRFFVASGDLSFAGTENPGQTLVTTDLGTPYSIEGLEFPKLLFAEFVAYSQKEAAPDAWKNRVELRAGQFYNWEAPADYIAKNENLLDHLCDDEDMDDKDCKELSAVLNAIERVSITDKNAVFYVRRDESRRRLNSVDSPARGAETKPFGGYFRRVLTNVLF